MFFMYRPQIFINIRRIFFVFLANYLVVVIHFKTKIDFTLYRFSNAMVFFADVKLKVQVLL